MVAALLVIGRFHQEETAESIFTEIEFQLCTVSNLRCKYEAWVRNKIEDSTGLYMASWPHETISSAN